MKTEDETYIHDLLDKLGVPRKTKADRDFTFFGRIFILIEKLTASGYKFE